MKRIGGVTDDTDETELDSLNGYFEHQNKLGKIEISPFKLKIKGITNSFEQEIIFTLSEWELLLHLFSQATNDFPLKFLLGKFCTSSNVGISKWKLKKRLLKIEKQELVSTEKI